MIDHRKLQRTLFRMQVDEDFATSLLDGNEATRVESGLGPDELALLDRVDRRTLRAALSADPGGKRRAQVLGNVASEFTLSLAAASATHGHGELLRAFLSSPEFHEAVLEDKRLPFAFADYARREAAEHGSHALSAILGLETAMAHVRRAASEPSPPNRLAPGWIQLAPDCRLCRVPDGTIAWGEALRKALEMNAETLPAPTVAAPGGDTVGVLLSPRRPRAEEGPRGPWQLPDVSAERLASPVDELLHRAQEALGPEERAAFAREHNATAEDLENFLVGFVADGILIAG